MAGHLPKGVIGHRLLILACSATKTKDPGRIPAFKRYDGPLWQTLRAADPERQKARVAFLSARFGFVESDRPIEDYDARLSPDLAQRMVEGGIGAAWPYTPPRGRSIPRMSSSVSAAVAMDRLNGPHELSERMGDPSTPAFVFNDVALVGGGLYLKVMRSLVAGFIEEGDIAPDARIVEINHSIGVMRKQLRAWLDEFEVSAPSMSVAA